MFSSAVFFDGNPAFGRAFGYVAMVPEQCGVNLGACLVDALIWLLFIFKKKK